MLSELVALLESREHGLRLDEIARALGAQPGAVRGMLDLLVQRGRLIAIGPDGNACAACGIQPEECSLLAVRSVRYVVAARAGHAACAPPCTPARPPA